MRIALFSWESMHSVGMGGVASHASELAQALTAEGNEVHLFTRLGRDQPSDDRVDRVAYHRCASGSSPDLVEQTDTMCGTFVDRFRNVDRETGGFAVVHAHDWFTARALARASGSDRRTVFTIHSTEYGRHGGPLSDSCSRAIRDREWLGAYCADRVITVSRHLKNEVRQAYNVPERKMRVVHDGVDVGRFDAPVDVGAVKRRYDLGPMDPTVMFCGRLVRQKGPDILLEAVPPLLGYYPHAKFVFVGDGEMRRLLEDRAQALGASHAVRFLGYRTGRELVELYRSCDAVCLPSRNEPFGIVILEAWSAGKPVVATMKGGPHEFVRHGIDGLTIHDNPDSVGWGIGTLFMDFDKARWMGRNGRRAAETRFNWRAIGREVAQGLRRVAPVNATLQLPIRHPLCTFFG